MAEPTDLPPSYEKATGGKAPETRNGIPPQHRRSMEDEHRELPKGWVRSYDPENHHQFFVDTTKDPPRSIWHHPFDDEEYLNSLSQGERANLNRLTKSVSLADIGAESSDDEDHAGPSRAAAPGPSGSSSQPTGIHKFGRKLKDKVTQSTHEEREGSRRQRAEQERKAYEAHIKYRQAMVKALETGQPQLIGKDRNGRDVFIEPPSGPAGPYGGNGYGYNPYNQGVYANPNARLVRPQYAYSRPYGYGYGGGLGFPLVGGVLAGSLLGAALF